MGRRASGNYSVGIKRREEIVRTATELFGAEGYYKTPMSAIAEAVGISEGGLAHHFPTKNVLLQAVAEQRLTDTADWWTTLPESGSALALFDEMVEATRHFTEQPGLIELFVMSIAESADPSSPAHTRIAERYERVVDQFEERLRQGVESGDIRSDVDLRMIASECIAMSDGLQVQWVLADGNLDIVARMADFAGRLKTYLKVG